MARDGLTKKTPAWHLKVPTRVFCRVPVQGFGGPRGTPGASCARLHCVRDGLLKFNAASMSNMHGDTAKHPHGTF